MPWSLRNSFEPIDDALIEVVAAEMRVAVRAQHFEAIVADREDRDIEGAAAEVVHRDFLVLFAVEAIRQRGRRRFVDDAQDFESGDLAGVFGGLALRVVEVRRHGDDGLGDGRAQIGFGGLFHLTQNHRRHLGRTMFLALHLDLAIAGRRCGHFVRHQFFFRADFRVLAAHEAFDREDRVLRIGDGLTLGRRADKALAVTRECDHRRRGPVAFRVGDDGRFAAFHDSHARIGRAQVNADDFTHCCTTSLLLPRGQSPLVRLFVIPPGLPRRARPCLRLLSTRATPDRPGDIRAGTRGRPSSRGRPPRTLA